MDSGKKGRKSRWNLKRRNRGRGRKKRLNNNRKKKGIWNGIKQDTI
jgi:hypothetical protein